MPTEISQTVDSIRSLIAQVPGALLAIALLVGPTVLWIAYRFLNAKPHSRFEDEDENGKALWICIQCRSASDLGRSRCYRCGLERGDPETLEFIAPPAAGSGGTDPRIAFPGIGIGPGPSHPVPSGRVLGPPGAPGSGDASDAFDAFDALDTSDAPDVSGPDRAPVAVGPGKPPVTIPRRYVVAERPVLVAVPVPVVQPDDAAIEEDAEQERSPAGSSGRR